MTTTVSPRVRRGASLAFGGLATVTAIMLGGAPPAWAEPGADAVGAIDDRYTAFGGEGSLLGAPVGEAVDVPGGAARDYQGGAIYYSSGTGAHVMYGAILDRYRSLGGPGGELGFPKNDESDTGDGTGRFNDFSAPEGASMYWTPQWGASVIKGKVLEAWRQSGGVTGPFGYPSTDTAIADGIQTNKFAGPEGTEIQWSQTAGLITIPAALAAKIPGFGTAMPTAEGTTSVTTPSTPAAPETETRSSRWWWIPAGLAAVALLAGLVRMARRKPAPEPVKAATPARTATPPPPPPAPRPVADIPVPKPAPPAPPRPAAPPPPAPPKPPAKVVPLVKTPPPAPKPPAPKPPAPPSPPMAEPPTVALHTASAGDDAAPVIKYASSAPPDTTIRVVYQNNAVDGEASRADKSDLTPDQLQE